MNKGLFDGHGGNECSQMAKEYLHFQLLQTDGWKEGDILKALEQAYEASEKYITTESAQKKYMSGTTAVSVVIAKKGEEMELYAANVGDTEAILVSEKPGHEGVDLFSSGNSFSSQEEESAKYPFTFLTQKHTPKDESEKKRIEEAEGMVIRDRVMGRIAVSRSLGDIQFKQPFNCSKEHWVSPKPHLFKIKLQDHHKFLIIATDGLWDVIPYHQAAELAFNCLRKNMNPKQICRFLVGAAIEAGSLDNITVTLVLLKQI